MNLFYAIDKSSLLYTCGSSFILNDRDKTWIKAMKKVMPYIQSAHKVVYFILPFLPTIFKTRLGIIDINLSQTGVIEIYTGNMKNGRHGSLP